MSTLYKNLTSLHGLDLSLCYPVPSRKSKHTVSIVVANIPVAQLVRVFQEFRGYPGFLEFRPDPVGLEHNTVGYKKIASS